MMNRKIRYIGKSAWTDRLYGSGLYFTPGLARSVSATLADKFLRHIDVFEEAEGEQPEETLQPEQQAETAQEPELEELEREQKAEREAQANLADTLDQINLMDKAALEQYARNNFRQELDRRQSLPTLREKVIGFVHQYGIP